MGLKKYHFALALFDIFAAHFQSLEKNRIFIPASCTGELQPLDLTVNQVFKQELKACFIRWYADLVKKQLEDGVQLENIKPDLHILHARWLIEAVSHLSSDVIIEGFVKAGIMDSITDRQIDFVCTIIAVIYYM